MRVWPAVCAGISLGQAAFPVLGVGLIFNSGDKSFLDAWHATAGCATLMFATGGSRGAAVRRWLGTIDLRARLRHRSATE